MSLIGLVLIPIVLLIVVVAIIVLIVKELFEHAVGIAVVGLLIFIAWRLNWIRF